MNIKIQWWLLSYWIMYMLNIVIISCIPYSGFWCKDFNLLFITFYVIFCNSPDIVNFLVFCVPFHCEIVFVCNKNHYMAHGLYVANLHCWWHDGDKLCCVFLQYGQTALHRAAVAGHIDVVKMLCDQNSSLLTMTDEVSKMYNLLNQVPGF